MTSARRARQGLTDHNDNAEEAAEAEERLAEKRFAAWQRRWAPAQISASPRFHLVVRPAAGKGRGLFAGEEIPCGAVVAQSLGWEMSEAQLAVFLSMPKGLWDLRNFYFTHPNAPERGILAAGLCELVNDSDSPNAVLNWQSSRDMGWVGTLTSVRTIGPGEEIVMRYSDC